MEPGSNRIGSLWDAAVRLRCPACGRGRIFEQIFNVKAACTDCGLPFAMGEGNFVGGIYLNYGIVAILCFALFFWMEAQGTYSMAQEITAMMTTAVLVPIISMRHSRAFFMATMFNAGAMPRRPRTDAPDGAGR
jgi:uncharacterized protein (DUF983 family)